MDRNTPFESLFFSALKGRVTLSVGNKALAMKLRFRLYDYKKKVKKYNPGGKLAEAMDKVSISVKENGDLVAYRAGLDVEELLSNAVVEEIPEAGIEQAITPPGGQGTTVGEDDLPPLFDEDMTPEERMAKLLEIQRMEEAGEGKDE